MAAVRYFAGRGAANPRGTLHLACHVKAGVSKKRQGILSVTDSVVELCVSAQAKEGEANQAVRELIADVGKGSSASTMFSAQVDNRCPC